MAAPAPFDSERLHMRATEFDDAEALIEIYSDEALMTYWSSAPKRTIEDVRDYIRPRIDWPDGRSWSITLQGDDRAIGTLSAVDGRAGVVEIGYSLARRYWGQGYAGEAVSALIDRLFDIDGYRRVTADTDPDNAASNKLLEKLGFMREGHLRAEWETHIGIRDSLIWGLLPGDRNR